jgi:hypothetical protein
LQVQKYLRQNGGKLSHPTSVIVFSDSGLKNLGESTLDGNMLGTALDGCDAIGLHAMHISPPNWSLPVFVTNRGGHVLIADNDIAAQIDDCVSDTKGYYA